MDKETDDNVTYLFGQEAHDQMALPFELDDTVNIPRGEYEDLLENTKFLDFLEDSVAPETWELAQRMYDSWNEDVKND